jgi:putative oxidoreductase
MFVSSSTLSSTTSARSQATFPAASGPIVLLGRILFVLIFVNAGPRLLWGQAVAFAVSQGVPMASIAVPIAGLLALAGGLSILLGYRAKLGAWLIALFLIGVTPMMHKFWVISDPMRYQLQLATFMRNVSMLGGALLISQFGAGPWSLDARRK